MGRIGPIGVWELLIILVVVLLIFGPRRLPEMAKGIGQSVREFRRGLKEMKNDFESESSTDEKPKKAEAPVAEAAAAETRTESKSA
jgi:sec-independent protein translocase protein TatA